MKAARLALLALACSAPLLASAQWQWLDKDGRKVFSDRAPPADIAPNRIVKQPGMRAVAVEATAAAPAAASSSGLVVPKVSGKDAALEEKRKLAEAAEAEKKKAQQASFQLARAENCQRARAGKATLDSGVRMVRANEKGEREILDDKQREAEGRKLDEVIARDCRVAVAQ